MTTVLISGGTGLVGKTLAQQLLYKGYKVIVLSRKKTATGTGNENLQYAQWNIEQQQVASNAIQQADYIIHLAGAGVMDKRWSPAYKKMIQDSRILSSRLIVQGLQNGNNKVKAVISASAIGWYGPDTAASIAKGGFTETDPADGAFLGDTCRQWEQSILPAQQLGKRLSIFRTGIVLSNDGGAFAEFKKPLRFGIAAILGNGRQVVSWIHIDDLCRMFIAAIENEKYNGVYNAVAPAPVNNKTLNLLLAQKTRGKFFIPAHVPSPILKLMLGESSIEVLKSTTVSCAKIQSAGFTFLYPSIDAALQELCS
ncbi:MAG TPA: TIGR01777 family oxidoreductase [Ferruginibacter sp.]|nr:TIGR01777 family oxidoreductase [Ferruginibacter sp.]HMP21080.1 TIGR01777 family oxidoreductase [Ferruginibacter sp.]